MNIMDAMIDTRACPRCNVEYPRSPEFFGKGQRKDGMHSWCLECRRGYIRGRTDPDESRRRAREWGEQNRDRARARCRQWARENPDLKAASDRRWYQENQERSAETRRRWQSENRERWLLIHAVAEHNRRVRKALNGGFATVEQVAARVAYFGWKCWMCGGPWDCIDHVIAIARGGSGWASNLRPACTSCNASKGAKPHKEVLR